MIFLLLAIISFPILEGFGQIQTEKGEGVFFVNMHPYSFKDESGYTVILGEISNNRDFPISGHALPYYCRYCLCQYS